MAPSAVTKSCHFPAPSPKRPLNPVSPDSSCWAEMRRAPWAGNVRRTSPKGASRPSSSRPRMVTLTLAPVRLAKRSQLT